MDGLYWADVALLHPSPNEWRETDSLNEIIFGDSIRVIFESDFGFQPTYRLGHVWMRQVFNMPARTVTQAFRLYPKPEPMVLTLDTPAVIKGTAWDVLRWLQVKQGGRYGPFFPLRLRVQQLRIVDPDAFEWPPADP